MQCDLTFCHFPHICANRRGSYACERCLVAFSSILYSKFYYTGLAQEESKRECSRTVAIGTLMVGPFPMFVENVNTTVPWYIIGVSRARLLLSTNQANMNMPDLSSIDEVVSDLRSQLKKDGGLPTSPLVSKINSESLSSGLVERVKCSSSVSKVDESLIVHSMPLNKFLVLTPREDSAVAEIGKAVFGQQLTKEFVFYEDELDFEEMDSLPGPSIVDLSKEVVVPAGLPEYDYGTFHLSVPRTLKNHPFDPGSAKAK